MKVGCALLLVTVLLSCRESAGERGEKIRFVYDESATANSSAYERQHLGFMVADLETLKVERALNWQRPFLPASTTKIFTAAVALAELGPDFRFETALLYDGDIDEGTLKGDLILRGGGDPNLAVKHLLAFIDVLKSKGVIRVEGRFLLDDGLLPNTPIIDKRMGGDKRYNPGLGAVNLSGNTVTARWRFNRRARSYNFVMTPDVDNRKMVKSPRKFLDNKELVYKAEGDTETWLYSPDFYRRNWGRTRGIPVRQPTMFVGKVFHKMAGHHGITVPQPEVAKEAANGKEIYTHKSRPLLSTIDFMLQVSSNIIADLTFLQIGHKLTGGKPTLEESGAAIAAYLKDVLPNIKWTGFELRNGSGLTSDNRISPEQMLGVLVWADRKTYAGRRFRTMLPISGAGWGTMRSRLYQPETAYRVFAKTGGVYFAVSLAGYYLTDDGKEKLFVQFYHDLDKRRYIDTYTNEKALKMRRGGGGWIGRHKNQIDSRLKKWLNPPASR